MVQQALDMGLDHQNECIVAFGEFAVWRVESIGRQRILMIFENLFSSPATGQQGIRRVGATTHIRTTPERFGYCPDQRWATVDFKHCTAPNVIGHQPSGRETWHEQTTTRA